MNLVEYKFSLTPRKSMRERVERLETFLAHVPPVDCPITNHFAPGVYIREALIPAGVAATGAVHKTEHLTIVSGHCHLTTDDGVQEFEGFHILHSKPGIKRAIVAIKDTKVATVHLTTETDLNKLCLELTESNPDELLGGANSPQVLAQKHTELEAI